MRKAFVFGLAITFLVCGSVLGAWTDASGATYTVCPPGGGCHYSTLTSALKSVTSGNTIEIQNGTYAERPYTNASSVIIRAATGHTPHVTGIIVNHDNITLDGLYFDTQGETTRSQFRIEIMSNRTGFLVQNVRTGLACTGGVSACEWGDIKVYQGSGSGLIRNNYFDRPTYVSFMLLGHGVVVENNTWTNAHADILYIFGTNHIIRNNTVTGIIGDSSLHSDFVQTFNIAGYPTNNILVEGNLVANAEAQIANIDGALPGDGNWTFRNNVFVNVRYAANVSLAGCKWYNNTFINCTMNTGGPLIYYPKGTGGEVRNNIFIGCGSPDGNNDGRGWWATDTSDLAASNNFVSKSAAAGYAPKSGWNVLNGNINGGDPKFVNPAANDFTLQADSPLIGKGVPIAGWTNPTDKLGTSRPQGGGWAIGAYEVSGSGGLSAPRNLRVGQ